MPVTREQVFDSDRHEVDGIISIGGQGKRSACKVLRAIQMLLSRRFTGLKRGSAKTHGNGKRLYFRHNHRPPPPPPPLHCCDCRQVPHPPSDLSPASGISSVVVDGWGSSGGVQQLDGAVALTEDDVFEKSVKCEKRAREAVCMSVCVMWSAGTSRRMRWLWLLLRIFWILAIAAAAAAQARACSRMRYGTRELDGCWAARV